MIFFDEEAPTADETRPKQGWRYTAKNAGAFLLMVALTTAGLFVAFAFFSYWRITVKWVLLAFRLVWDAL